MTHSPSDTPAPPIHRVLSTPLTPEAFAAYGDVARPGSGDVKTIRGGAVRLSKTATAFEHQAEAPDARLDFYEVQPTTGALIAQTIERHPWSTQMFSPMSAADWLVVVWPDGPDGAPVAFVAGPLDVVTYRPGLWHHGIVALDRPACFASMMWKSPDGVGDTEFRQLAAPVTIDWPQP